MELRGIGLVLFSSGGNSLGDEYGVLVIARKNRIKRDIGVGVVGKLFIVELLFRALVLGELVVVELVVLELSSSRSCCWQTLGIGKLALALSSSANSWRRRTRALALVKIALSSKLRTCRRRTSVNCVGLVTSWKW